MSKIIKNPFILFYEIFRRYPFKTIFSFILVGLYIALHEFVHYWTLLFYGYKSVINWNIFLPTVTIPDAVNLFQIIIVASTPHLFSLLLIIILFGFRKNVYAKIISTVAWLDFTVNLLMMPVAFWLNRPNDFRLMLFISKLWFAYMMFVWLVACVFWIFTVFHGIKYKKMKKK